MRFSLRPPSKFSRQSLWTGSTPGLVGASLLVLLASSRAFASATPEGVFVFGRELQWGCLFQRAFGIPCPICGMTRGVLLTLEGHLADALRLNPAAPLLVAGLVVFAFALVFVALYQRAHDPLSAGRLHARVRIISRAYVGLLFVVLFAHWIAQTLPLIVKAI